MYRHLTVKQKLANLLSLSRRKNEKLLFIIISVTLLANFAYSFNEGTTGAQFLKILVGSKATAMGGAFVSIADDPSALYYNPAGIATMNKMGILLNYVKYPAEISYSYVGFVSPMGIAGSFWFTGRNNDNATDGDNNC